MIIGLDIGGTSLKLGLWASEPAPGGTARLVRRSWEDGLPLPVTAHPASVADHIAALVERCAGRAAGSVQALGIGSCGLLADGTIFQSPNTPWDSLPLAALLRTRLAYPVFLLNDADAFLIDALCGLPEDGLSALGITLGTGLGTAVWLHGRLLAGGSGISPEGGHITLDYHGAAANTGIPGSWESLCCSAALMRYYAEAGGTAAADPRAVTQAAEEGQAPARAAWERFGECLGAGLGTLVNLFSPRWVLIGGGLSGAHPWFSPALDAALERGKLRALPLPAVRFLPEEQDSVARGAARYAGLQLQVGADADA